MHHLLKALIIDQGNRQGVYWEIKLTGQGVLHSLCKGKYTRWPSVVFVATVVTPLSQPLKYDAKSFHFQPKFFILVNVVLDPDPLPEPLGGMQGYTLDGMPTHCRAHSFTPRGNLELPIHILACLLEVGGNHWKPTPIIGKHAKLQNNPSTGLNQGPWSCETSTWPTCWSKVLPDTSNYCSFVDETVLLDPQNKSNTSHLTFLNQFHNYSVVIT